MSSRQKPLAAVEVVEATAPADIDGARVEAGPLPGSWSAQVRALYA